MQNNRHAYIILAHNQWELLECLLKALDDERNDIYLHIDKKVSQPPYEKLEAAVTQSGLYFVKRWDINWGGTQMMKCTLSMLEQAYEMGYSHYHLLSGVDYPLKSQNYIHDYFEKNTNKQFVGFDWEGIDAERFKGRVQYYHFLINIIGKRDREAWVYRILERVEDGLLALQHKLGVDRAQYRVFKGSSWFSITNDAVEFILAQKRRILKVFCFCANTDELWLQTFLMNSTFAESIGESNKRYIKWVQGNPSPEVLTMDDYDDMLSSDKLFARKFDWNKDRQVIEALSQAIQKD